MRRSSDLLSLANFEIEAAKRGLIDLPPLWPSEFCDVSRETCYRFVTECCWTYNEANGGNAELIPEAEYVKLVCGLWLESVQTGRPLIIEKSRRMIVSWMLRGLELWRLGLKPEKGVVTGLNYDKSAEHVWRIWWLYKELRNRRKDWKLPVHQGRGGNEGAQMFSEVLLPNGSLVESLNQEGGSFQGSGYSFVTLEEFSMYKNPAYMWGQAQIVCAGIPGSVGGTVVAVTNANSSKPWQEIKRA